MTPMYRFTLSILILIAALAGTWSILDKHIVTALVYYAAGGWFYMKLERDVFKE